MSIFTKILTDKMKKKFLLLLSIILLTINVSAQYKEFQFGLMGQPGYSWLNVKNENVSNVRNAFSYKYGLFGTYYMSENYGLSTGILFLNNRATYDFNYDDESTAWHYSHNFKNTYIQVPLTFRGRTDLISNILRITGQFGVSMDFLIEHGDVYTCLSGTTEHLNVKHRVFDTSLIIALGTEIQLFKTSGLMLQVVFDKDFTNLFKAEDATEKFYKSPIRMSSLYFEIGFAF